MITLHGITLPDSLFWEDRFQWQPVAQSADRTLDGSIVTYSTGLVYGRPITLVATESNGWIGPTTANNLVAVASIPGLKMSLTIGSVFTGFVVFRHTDAPALDLTPLFNTQAGSSTEYYIGTIKLLTVG